MARRLWPNGRSLLFRNRRRLNYRCESSTRCHALKAGYPVMGNSTNESGQTDPSSRRSQCVFSVYKATAQDLARVKGLSPDACPRRYCWWWHSLAFDWHVEPAEGCTFLTSEKPPGIAGSDSPCKRSAPESSAFDHYEPREPCLADDGVDGGLWLRWSTEQGR